MTSRDELRRPLIAPGPAIGLALGLGLLLVLPACGKEEEPEPEPEPRRVAPPPPPAPRPVTLSSVRQRLDGIDQRVTFDQQHAPTDAALAELVFTLADGFAQQNADAMYPLLSETGDRVLDQVSQDWFDMTIEAVRVVSMDSSARTQRNPSNAMFVLAIQTDDGANVVAFRATRGDGGWIADPAPASLETRRLASDWDEASHFSTESVIPTDLEVEEDLDTESGTPGTPSTTGGGGGGRSTEVGG